MNNRSCSYSTTKKKLDLLHYNLMIKNLKQMIPINMLVLNINKKQLCTYLYNNIDIILN